MAEGDGKSVGRIGRLWKLTEAEETGDHLLHLFLVSGPIAGDGRFHRGGDVLEHGNPCLGGHEEGNTGGPAHRDGGLEVAIGEDRLQGDDIGTGI
jgi:hypothetical protein